MDWLGRAVVVSASLLAGCAMIAGLEDPPPATSNEGAPPSKTNKSSGGADTSGSSGATPPPPGPSGGTTDGGATTEAGGADSGKNPQDGPCQKNEDCQSGKCSEERTCVGNCRTPGGVSFYECSVGGDDCCLGSYCVFVSAIEGGRCRACIAEGGTPAPNARSCCSGTIGPNGKCT